VYNFTNTERKEMFLSLDTVAFTADESAAEKIAITMTDQDGITIESTKPIVFDAQLGINIEAEKNISIEATQLNPIRVSAANMTIIMGRTNSPKKKSK